MFRHARAIFAHLKKNGSDAPTFTSRLGVEAMKYFHSEMQTKFPCLAFAGGDWKSEKIGVYIYPQWWRTHGDVEVDAEAEAEVLDVDVEMSPASTLRKHHSYEEGAFSFTTSIRTRPEKAETPK